MSQIGDQPYFPHFHPDDYLVEYGENEQEQQQPDAQQDARDKEWVNDYLDSGGDELPSY